MTKTKAYVYQGNTLCYRVEGKTNWFSALATKDRYRDLGSPVFHVVDPELSMRPATLSDFDLFYVCSGGYLDCPIPIDQIT